MVRKILLTLIALLGGGILLSQAQSKQISGTVTGSDGKPIAGVTVVVEGTSAMGSPISIDSEHITVTYADGTAPSADYSETFFNVLPDDSYGDLTFSACTNKGNAASFTIPRTKPVVANWVYTVDQTASFTKAAAPTVKWIGHEDLTTPTELLESGNSANIRVSAPGGIKSMQVDITSAPLATLLPAFGLAESMDLTSPATEEMASMLAQLGFPTPAQLLNQQHVYFQIGGLIDMLAMVCAEVTETAHSDFRFTVTDNAGQQTTVTLQYAKTIASAITPGAAYNDDANFWTNTATLACVVAPEDFQHTTVEYKRTDGTWQAAAKGTPNAEDGTFTATISSAYNADNTMISETGIRPGHRYEYRLVIDGTTKASGTIDLTAENGDPIQNGGMEDWSTTTLGSNKNIVYPNASGNSFWTSGNNGQTTGLCTKNENIWIGNTSGSYCAYLKPNLTSIGSIKIFAAGNLFTGSFDYTVSIFGWSGGTASFGSPYAWTARPTALRVKARATVGNIQTLGAKKNELSTSDISPARIFVCICDRDTRIDNVSQTKALSGEYNISGTFEPRHAARRGLGHRHRHPGVRRPQIHGLDRRLADHNHPDRLQRPRRDAHPVEGLQHHDFVLLGLLRGILLRQPKQRTVRRRLRVDILKPRQ